MTNTSLELLKNTINASALRQDAINSNIANVNTDNYKVNQVEFESLLNAARDGVAIKKMNASHFGAERLTEIQPVISKRTNSTVKENGNNVDLDMEMVNLSENTLYYQALISQLNGQYSRLKTVING